MNEDIIVSTVSSVLPLSIVTTVSSVLQLSATWAALLAGVAPAAIANPKQHSKTLWYLYGVACALVAWPLIALPIAHAFSVRSRHISPKIRQKQRRADALAL